MLEPISRQDSLSFDADCTLISHLFRTLVLQASISPCMS